MFADPLVLVRNWSVITAAANDISIPASERAADHSSYRTQDTDLNDHLFTIGHQYGRRNRVTARYTVTGYTPSLLVPDQNQTFSQSVYVVADVPPGGPIEATSTITNIFRCQLKAIGGLLISVGLGTDPTFYRAIKGET